MTLSSMVMQSLLSRALNPLHLEVKPTRLRVAGRVLAAGAVGVVIGAAAMALLAPSTGANTRATLKKGLSRVTHGRLGEHLPPNGAGTRQTPVSAQAGA